MAKASLLRSMARCSSSASLLANRLRELLWATATRAEREQGKCSQELMNFPSAQITLSLRYWGLKADVKMMYGLQFESVTRNSK